MTDALVRRLTNIKQASGLDSLKMVRALPSGGVATVTDMGGILKAVVRVPQESHEEEEPTHTHTPKIPMLFSGTIERARILEGRGVEMALSKQTLRRLQGYRADAPDVNARQELRRFDIPYPSQCTEFIPKDSGALKHTQYVQLRPTWFSGAMAQVVQIVSGYGRQDLSELPKNKIERAVLAVPEKVWADMQFQVGNKALPGYRGDPPKSGQIAYDYKFHSCNGVAFASDGKPWLLRVNARGVYAMPLPLIPLTTTAAFREWVVDVAQDDEIEAILDRFGGMPSGEGFPLGETMDAWERAGVVVRLCDTASFYSNLGYATTCGWSFNRDGSSACNTAYNYEPGDDGMAYGAMFMMDVRIGATLFDGALPSDWRRTEVDEKNRLNFYLSGIYGAVGARPKIRSALLYKIRRIPASELLLRERLVNGSEDGWSRELDWLDARRFPAIANASGGVRQIKRGWLMNPAKPQAQPQIKFPEPLLSACRSFVFSPPSSPAQKQTRCDTPMFCFYDQKGVIHIVNYFYDPRKFVPAKESTMEGCMTVGAWQESIAVGEATLSGHFYTNLIDARGISVSKSVTDVVGKDLGFSISPGHRPVYSWAMTGFVYRLRYVAHTTTKKSVWSHIETSICVPYLCRDLVLHADLTSGSESGSESVQRLGIGDPNQYEYFTIHPKECIFSTPSVPLFLDLVAPVPKDGAPIWGWYYYDLGASECADFADQGPWAGTGMTELSGAIGPVVLGWGAGSSDTAPYLKEYSRSLPVSSTEKGSVRVAGGCRPTATAHGRVPAIGYFLQSPDEVLGYFYRDACQVVFGKSAYTNVSESLDGQGPRRWSCGYTRLADHKSAHHFIGVINE